MRSSRFGHGLAGAKTDFRSLDDYLKLRHSPPSNLDAGGCDRAEADRKGENKCCYGGLDMRGTTSFLKRFWEDHSGATPQEVAITIAIFGVLLARTVIKASG
jgi:hypothetical protein